MFHGNYFISIKNVGQQSPLSNKNDVIDGSWEGTVPDPSAEDYTDHECEAVAEGDVEEATKEVLLDLRSQHNLNKRSVEQVKMLWNGIVSIKMPLKCLK